MQRFEWRRRDLAQGFILLCVVLATGCVDMAAQGGIVDRVERRFDVAGAPVVDVSTFDGRISVSTWRRPEVLIVIEKHAADREHADRMQVTAAQAGNRITLDVRQVGPRRAGFRSGPFSARLLVTVPVRADVSASSGDGPIEVADLEGAVDVQTGDGAIHVAGVTGDVSARSGDGGIAVEGRIGDVRVRSGDGGVTVRAHRGSAPSSGWSIWTGDGSVSVELPDGFDADLDARTGDGRIAVAGIAFEAQGAAPPRRSLRGRIGAGGQPLRIHTGDGSISVRGVSQ